MRPKNAGLEMTKTEELAAELLVVIGARPGITFIDLLQSTDDRAKGFLSASLSSLLREGLIETVDGHRENNAAYKIKAPLPAGDSN